MKVLESREINKLALINLKTILVTNSIFYIFNYLWRIYFLCFSPYMFNMYKFRFKIQLKHIFIIGFKMSFILILLILWLDTKWILINWFILLFYKRIFIVCKTFHIWIFIISFFILNLFNTYILCFREINNIAIGCSLIVSMNKFILFPIL